MAGRQPYIRIQWFLKRKDGMSSEDFHEYWEKVHADFALSLPGFKQIAKRYIQVSHILDSKFIDSALMGIDV
jgi:EthD domain